MANQHKLQNYEQRKTTIGLKGSKQEYYVVMADQQQLQKQQQTTPKNMKVLFYLCKPTTIANFNELEEECTNLCDSIPRKLLFDVIHCDCKIEDSAHSSARSNDEDVFQIQVGVSFQLEITSTYAIPHVWRLALSYLSKDFVTP
jgi:hypothetical protein